MNNLKGFQDELKKTIVGQDQAVNVITTVIYKYLLKLHGRDFGLHFNSSTTLLLLGDSGVGKTFIIRSAAELTGLPFIELNAKSVCQEGWAGKSFIDMLEAELRRYPDGIKGGIIFLDEFDKMCTPNISSKGEDVNQSIQASILKYVEGFKLNDHTRVNTKNFLFVFAGAFVDLIKKENAKIGFVEEKKPKLTLQLLTESLINYGMLPEFAGRIQEFCILNKLTRKDYKQILQNKEFNLYKWNALLEKLDIQIKHLEDDLLDRAVKAKLGVRGLLQAVEELVTHTINKNIEEFDLNKLNPLYTKPLKEDE